MKDNKGFSLVELIVVIAIMSILAGAISVSFRLVWGTYARECAKNIESQLNSARVSTMGKKNQGVHIFRGNDKAYYAELVEFDATSGESGALTVLDRTDLKRVGRKSIELYYACDGGSKLTLESTDGSATVGALGSEGTDIYIFYDRSSGAFASSPVSGNCCSDIWVKQGNKEFHLKLYKETGKVELQ